MTGWSLRGPPPNHLGVVETSNKLSSVDLTGTRMTLMPFVEKTRAHTSNGPRSYASVTGAESDTAHSRCRFTVIVGWMHAMDTGCCVRAAVAGRRWREAQLR